MSDGIANWLERQHPGKKFNTLPEVLCVAVKREGPAGEALLDLQEEIFMGIFEVIT